jgi:hypothetical protein
MVQGLSGHSVRTATWTAGSPLHTFEGMSARMAQAKGRLRPGCYRGAK